MRSADTIASGKREDMSDVRPRLAIIVIVVWVLLQIPRLIAIPLIQDVLAGHDSPAWLFPAILDVVVAVAAPFVAFVIWRKRGLAVWVVTIIFFVVSIVDHMDAVTAGLSAPVPRVFEGVSGTVGPGLVPAIQTVIDVVMLVVLTRRKIVSYYLDR